MRRISPQPPSGAAASEAISAKSHFITTIYMYPDHMRKLTKHSTKTHQHARWRTTARPCSHRTPSRRARSRLRYRTQDLNIPSESSWRGEEYCVQAACARARPRASLALFCRRSHSRRLLRLPCQQIPATCAHARHKSMVRQEPGLMGSLRDAGAEGSSAYRSRNCS